jgi:hypothetical protein
VHEIPRVEGLRTPGLARRDFGSAGLQDSCRAVGVWECGSPELRTRWESGSVGVQDSTRQKCETPHDRRKSTGTPIPNAGVPLGVSILSHSLALPGACGLLPRFRSWPVTLQPLTLVAIPRLKLGQACAHGVYVVCNKIITTLIQASLPIIWSMNINL